MAGDPTKPKPRNSVTPYISPEELQQFGNWTGQQDSRVMAQDLMKRGLINANQLADEQVSLGAGAGIRNAQSAWKTGLIQEILSNARKYNLRTPTEVNANRNVLVQNPRWKAAVNDPYFNHVHPNFWNIITDSILPEQYAKFDKQNSVVKK